MFRQFINDEKGQTTVEYLLIIAVIVVVISILGKGLQTKMQEVMNTVFSNINKKINTLMSAGAQ